MADKLSLIIPHVPYGAEADTMLDRCLASLAGYDEFVLVVNDGIGYGEAFNRGMKYAHGDYLLCVSNDTVLTSGTLSALCDPKAVTFSANAQWGAFFCLPRWVYEKVGGFDVSFGKAYYEDDDYLIRLEEARVPLRRVKEVEVNHIGGATVKALGIEQESSQIGSKRFLEKWGTRHAVIPEL